MSEPYDHKAIEAKWQKRWADAGLYKTPDTVAGKENFYTLVEFLYTSGDAHIGHWYAFSVPDIFARMKRMQGYNVLYPMGFDAFGLPAENAAIKNKVDPAAWTLKNIERARTQLSSIGASFDWSREVITCAPDYYRWTQWLFLQFFKKDLAYRKKAFINWCPKDQTVLANEQVINGRCERCDTEVVQKELEQWFFKITAYADRLIDDLDSLDWPRAVKEAQKNWIGRSEGAEIDFTVSKSDFTVTVFTTRADTLFGATYLVLAPEHPLLEELPFENREEIEAYVTKARNKSDLERAEMKEKTGVELKGITAINPGTQKEIPIWVADYVIGSYGTGAIMAVPAHDERDHEFAEKFELPIVSVVDDALPPDEAAKRRITESVGGRMAKKYKLRDWLISRQRYWGAPIPIVYDPEGKAHPIPDEHLPWTLPTDVDFAPTGEAPLARSKELRARTEKIFGKGWRPETDTMDGFVDNSWYFLRYLDPQNTKEFSSLEKQKQWMPVDRYSGGSEHTTVHVLYSRFFYKVLHDLGLVTHTEPYTVRMNRGIILAEDGRKMSKRWGNVVNPDEQVLNVGADSVRTYFAFIGPYNEVGSFPWNTNGLIGVRRFLERAWSLKAKVAGSARIPSVELLVNQTIKKVGDDIESMKFNTSVSALMILSNELAKLDQVPLPYYEAFLVLLAPFAPHLTEELWQALGHTTSIHLEAWPTYDPGKLESGEVIIAVQIGGKTKGTIQAPQGISEADIIVLIKGDPKLGKSVPESIKRVVYVPGRIVNFIPN